LVCPSPNTQSALTISSGCGSVKRMVAVVCYCEINFTQDASLKLRKISGLHGHGINPLPKASWKAVGKPDLRGTDLILSCGWEDEANTDAIDFRNAILMCECSFR